MTAQVLIIEDTPVNLKLISMLLNKSGYRVLGAENANDGIALAHQHLPDLILMDIQLPGMDGLAATRLLKDEERTRHIPIIALTALAMKGDEEKVMAAACDGYIAKPIQYKNFLSEVKRILSLPAILTTNKQITIQKKILIVDDDPRNRKLEKTFLSSNGYQVHSVDSGQAALDAVATELPDLILLDLKLPGMDGFEVVRRLKANANTAALPIIMVTALDDVGSRARLAAAGISELITKPVGRWTLQASIDRLLGTEHGND